MSMLSSHKVASVEFLGSTPNTATVQCGLLGKLYLPRDVGTWRDVRVEFAGIVEGACIFQIYASHDTPNAVASIRKEVSIPVHLILRMELAR